MKKLLLVLLVVALASFLLVGCFGVPDGTEGEDEDEGEVGICPTVEVTTQFAAVGGKTYIKGGKQTITVTFAVPTEPISVYVGFGLRVTTLEELLQTEVVMYANADKTVYTGKFEFGVENKGCSEAYIYVETCGSCAPCKFPYTVDTLDPTAKIEICSDSCLCPGCTLSFKSTTTEGCTDTVDCGDACSGLASWSIAIYDDYPFGDCCDASCVTPIASGSGVCPIDFTTSCLTTVIDNVPAADSVFAVVTLVDNVGNDAKWGATIAVVDYDTCDHITITPYTAGPGITDKCLDDATGIFTECAHYVLAQ